MRLHRPPAAAHCPAAIRCPPRASARPGLFCRLLLAAHATHRTAALPAGAVHCCPPPTSQLCIACGFSAAHRLCPNYASPGAFPPAARGFSARRLLPAVHADKPHRRSTALRERFVFYTLGDEDAPAGRRSRELLRLRCSPIWARHPPHRRTARGRCPLLPTAYAPTMYRPRLLRPPPHTVSPPPTAPPHCPRALSIAAHRLCPNYASPAAFPPAAALPVAAQTLSLPDVHADKPHSRSTALREGIRNAREGVTGREK